MNLKVTVDQRILAFGRFLGDHYFRAKLIFRGEDTRTLHQGKPVIFISNHSGMNYPWDNLMLYLRLKDFFGASFKLMPLAAPALSAARILQPFAMKFPFFAKFTAPCTTGSFDAVAAAGFNIMMNPEGIPGIAKGFNKKYRLQRFSSSFVRVGLEMNRPIVPIYVINGEYLNPFAYALSGLNKLVQKLGVPYLSLGLLTPLYVLFPFAMYISLPARLRYVVGDKIDLRDLCAKPVDKMTLEDFRTVAERVRVIMQRDLNAYVQEFGQEKFAFKELIAEMRQLSMRDVLKLIPFSWAFVIHHIDGEKAKGLTAGGWFASIAMTLPLVGWPLFWIHLLLNSSMKEKAEENIHPARALNLGKVA